MTFRVILVAKFKRSPGYCDPHFYVARPYNGEPITLPRYERPRRVFADSQLPIRAIDFLEMRRAALWHRVNMRAA